jgi:hypothetical protein
MCHPTLEHYPACENLCGFSPSVSKEYLKKLQKLKGISKNIITFFLPIHIRYWRGCHQKRGSELDESEL